MKRLLLTLIALVGGGLAATSLAAAPATFGVGTAAPTTLPSASAGHTVTVEIPNIVMVRVRNVSGNTSAPTMDFNFDSAAGTAYLDANLAATGSLSVPFDPTTYAFESTNIAAVEALSTTTKATVTISASVVANGTGLTANDLTLGGTGLGSGASVTTSGTGWQPVASPSQFALTLDPTVLVAGTATYTVTYTATAQ